MARIRGITDEDPMTIVQANVKLPRCAVVAVREESARSFRSIQDVYLDLICARFPAVKREIQRARKRTG